MFAQKTSISPFDSKSDDLFKYKKSSQESVIDMDRYAMDKPPEPLTDFSSRSKGIESIGGTMESANSFLEEDKKEDESWLPEPFGPFADKAIRKAFVRKVYGILTIQLSFTIILGIIFLSV